jgi:hypothetical protein
MALALMAADILLRSAAKQKIASQKNNLNRSSANSLRSGEAYSRFPASKKNLSNSVAQNPSNSA